MQPQKQSAPRPMQDVAPPSAAFKPDIVKNIPVKAPAGPSRPANEDDELNKIIQDVNQGLAKSDRPAKKHFSLFTHHPKAPVAQTQPPPRPQPIPAQQQAAQTRSTKPVVAPRPPKHRRLPVLVIFLTILVTGALIAAAYSAYK
ncbi:MAG TPA: hypothetical protein VHD84_02970 [Candidatus Saccharimonadales bacterium]|nr:hypothetical protein [Candidatus Saccharimonadales bacterium]